MCRRRWRPSSKYVSTEGIPPKRLMKMAKLGVVIDGWMKRHELDISAVQCWTSHGGVLRRGALHRDEHDERRAAFERLRSGRAAAWWACMRCGWLRETPSALLDWNNNYGDDPEQGRLLPLQQSAKAFLRGRARWITRRSSRARSAS